MRPPKVSALLLPLVLIGCEEPTDRTTEITHTRVAKKPARPALPGIDSATRFGFKAVGEGRRHFPGDGHDHGPKTIQLEWDTPREWTKKAPMAQYNPRFQLPGHPEAECVMGRLPRARGTLEKIVNHWRSELGLPGLDKSGMAKLERRTVLQLLTRGGIPAWVVELEGDLQGHGHPHPDFKLVGVVFHLIRQTVLVKMVGPRLVVDAQRPVFDRFINSLRPARFGRTAFKGPGVVWTRPAGWVSKPAAGALRDPNYSLPDRPEFECYVSKVGGRLEINVSRWRRQMGGAEAKQLPPRPILNGTAQAQVVELEGTFKGMRMKTGRPDYLMVAAFIQLGRQVYTVKMTGPREMVRGQRARFDELLDTARLDLPKPRIPPPPFTWARPERWVAREIQTFRNPHFGIEDDPQAECYVSTNSGGILKNVNFWRNQMGKPPLTEAQLAGQVKRRVLGTQAVFLEVEGAYTGFGEKVAKPGFKLLGAILTFKGRTLCIKLVGPEQTIDREFERFNAFIAGLKPRGPRLPHDHPKMGNGGEEHDKPLDLGLEWTAPPTWIEGAARSQRQVTFFVGVHRQVECWVGALQRRAGGVDKRANTWRAEVGLAPLSADEVADLPKFEVLGRRASYVEAQGRGKLILGMAVPMPDYTLFITLIGPEVDARKQRKAFIDFCTSLREKK